MQQCQFFILQLKHCQKFFPNAHLQKVICNCLPGRFSHLFTQLEPKMFQTTHIPNVRTELTIPPHHFPGVPKYGNSTEYLLPALQYPLYPLGEPQVHALHPGSSSGLSPGEQRQGEGIRWGGLGVHFPCAFVYESAWAGYTPN